MEERGKRGLSGVVTVVILIALTFLLVSIVWVVVNNLVLENIGSVEGCTDAIGKIEINRLYTCYDHSNNIFQFSVSMGDIEPDGLLVSISSQGSGNSFTLTPTGFEGLGAGETLTGFAQPGVSLPNRNSGLTYNYTITSEPDFMSISPNIGGNDCGEADRVLDFPSCASLVN